MDNGNDFAHSAFIMKAEIGNQLVDEPHSAFEAQDPKVESGIVANSSAPVYIEVGTGVESQTISADGNVVALIDADGSGELSAIYDYDVFGNLIRATGAAASLFLRHKNVLNCQAVCESIAAYIRSTIPVLWHFSALFFNRLPYFML